MLIEILWVKFRGIGCGVAKVPGVYVNVTNMIDWIQKTIMANSGTDTTPVGKNLQTTLGSGTTKATTK